MIDEQTMNAVHADKWPSCDDIKAVDGLLQTLT